MDKSVIMEKLFFWNMVIGKSGKSVWSLIRRSMTRINFLRITSVSVDWKRARTSSKGKFKDLRSKSSMYSVREETLNSRSVG
ncbi:hypothetical protein WICPIJ_003706 [Wickerhamomyces pijperi]|uniref:Uncharacterized protein n=1 Tax=Wickerhamomyces pijperi TaxID=599730 RepID=A0A9P8TNM6_WICPI|nr:hypothetical protein WICPIJ_003706 [Wickerhamomyces pijperi]